MYKRAEYQQIIDRLKEARKFIQVVIGPRQEKGIKIYKSRWKNDINYCESR